MKMYQNLSALNYREQYNFKADIKLITGINYVQERARA